jgi:glutathione reductase (NADPH)
VLLAADLVVPAAGRVPKTRQLDLAAANVKTDERGAVEVNEYLQSVSNPRVYAAGDATLPPGSLPLTPVAAHEGLVVASNLLHGNRTKPDYRGVPSVVFTVPPLARVGLTEAEARRQQLDVRVNAEATGPWFSNRRVRETAAMFKTIVEAETDRILGAHLLGPHAEEVINLFALAVRHGLTARSLKHMIYAYPTPSSDVPYML